METQLVKLGKSWAIRIRAAMLKQARIQKDVQVVVEGDQIVIRAAKTPREGWAESYRLMAEHGDDALLDAPLPSLTSFDEEEWEW